MRQAVILARSESRHGTDDLRRATQILSARGIAVVQSHLVATRRALRKRVKQAVKSRAKLIVVCGGDGSQGAAVDVMAYSAATLGIIPAGTGNSFAQSLGIESSMEEAAAIIGAGITARIDLGRVNGTYFANFATIGLAAQIGTHTSRTLKRTTGPVAYALSGIGPMLFHRPFACTVKWRKKVLKLKTDQVIIGRYFGDVPILPNVTPIDGRLAFFATRARGKWSILRTYLAFLRGKQTTLPEAHFFTASKIRVEASRAQPVSIDGSSFGKTPARFSVARRALRVLVPANFPGAQ